MDYHFYGRIWRTLDLAHTDCKNTDKASNNTSRDYVDYKMIRWNKSAAENLFDKMTWIKIPDTAAKLYQT